MLVHRIARWMILLAGVCPACAAGVTARAPGPDGDVEARFTQFKRNVASSSRLASANQTIAELTRVEADIASANLEGDADFFRRLEADEYLFTSEDGRVTTREDEMQALARPRSIALDSYVVDSLTVKAIGDVGIVWGLAMIEGRSATGEAVHRRLRFTHVFQRWSGRWHLAAGHESPLPRKE